MKKRVSRMISAALALALCLGMSLIPASAAETEANVLGTVAVEGVEFTITGESLEAGSELTVGTADLGEGDLWSLNIHFTQSGSADHYAAVTPEGEMTELFTANQVNDYYEYLSIPSEETRTFTLTIPEEYADWNVAIRFGYNNSFGELPLEEREDVSFTDVAEGDWYYNFVIPAANAGWFTGKHSFWSVDMGLDVDMDANLPLEAFRFLKEGMTSDPSSYSIRNLSMTGDVYAYVSVGYSRDLEELVDGLRVGAKARFIASVSSVDMNIEQLDIDMSSGKWAASSKAYANIYSGLLDFGFDESGMLDLSRTSFSPTGFVSGMGASFDIGAEYTISEGTPVDGLRFSVSVTDLGFISHMADMTTSVESAEGIQFEGVDHINDPDMDINGELSGLMDDLYSMLAFKKKDVTGNQTRMLAATLYGGIDYTFLHDKMNVGLLYSARFGRYRTDHELTLAWNYAPSKKFDIALSYSFLRNASSIGWLITFTPKKGIGLFVGSDYTSLKYDALSFSGIKIPVPSNLFIDFNFGFTISLGRNQRPDAD